MRMLLTHILESDPEIRVIGSLGDGEAALKFVKQRRPDVILMDIHLPGPDGFEITRRIMESYPVPIIICSVAVDPTEVATTFRIMEAGAVACVEKPVSPEAADFESISTDLLQTVKLMSEVRVVRRWARARSSTTPAVEPVPSEDLQATTSFRVVAIGASTGGPPVLQTILRDLPRDFGLPLLIVQHIAHGFLPGLAEWLTDSTGIPTQIAAFGMLPLPGHAYLAPDDYHMGVSSSGRIHLTRSSPENGLRPSVSYLFRAVAEAYGSAAVGILLTGMGKDGAAELKLMKNKGAVTIAQDSGSSVVHGMPGEAIRLDAATYVWSAGRIATGLVSIVAERERVED